jgi:hypothetical protein
MTPKEKAKELVEKFYHIKIHVHYSIAKQCALIAVDDILEIFKCSPQLFVDTLMYKYWQQVKIEIEKL